MDLQVLRTLGQIAGIGGLALGVFLLLFRAVIQKSVFRMLTEEQSYRLLRLVILCVWSIAVIGIFALVYMPPPSTKTGEGGYTPRPFKGPSFKLTTETMRVKAATPAGQQEIEITYSTNSIGMKLVKIPAGEFKMGGEEPLEEFQRKANIPFWDRFYWGTSWAELFTNGYPQHGVKITMPFYMSAFEVTQQEYKNIMEKNPSSFSWKGERNPVDSVSWSDAREFCDRLSVRECLRYRLPTEAEW